MIRRTLPAIFIFASFSALHADPSGLDSMRTAQLKNKIIYGFKHPPQRDSAIALIDLAFFDSAGTVSFNPEDYCIQDTMVSDGFTTGYLRSAWHAMSFFINEMRADILVYEGWTEPMRTGVYLYLNRGDTCQDIKLLHWSSAEGYDYRYESWIIDFNRDGRFDLYVNETLNITSVIEENLDTYDSYVLIREGNAFRKQPLKTGEVKNLEKRFRIKPKF